MQTRGWAAVPDAPVRRVFSAPSVAAALRPAPQGCTYTYRSACPAHLQHLLRSSKRLRLQTANSTFLLLNRLVLACLLVGAAYFLDEFAILLRKRNLNTIATKSEHSSAKTEHTPFPQAPSSPRGSTRVAPGRRSRPAPSAGTTLQPQNERSKRRMK